MSLDTIQIKVAERVDQMPGAVFERVFDKFRVNHVKFANHHSRTNECDCEYCRSLRLYVSTKLSLHRTRRRYLGDEYSMDELPTVEEKLNSLKEVVRYQRAQKNLAATF